MALVKEVKTTSGGSKSDKRRSHKPTANNNANPYSGKSNDADCQDDDYHHDASHNNGVFITYNSKDYNFDDFVDLLKDKHEREKTIECLYVTKLKCFKVDQPPITPAMAEDLLSCLRGAMGMGGSSKGGKGSKGKSTTDGVPSPSVAAEREAVVACGTALVIGCGHESKQLFDQWGEVLMSTVVGIIKGLRSQMEDFIHSSNIVEGSVKAVIASPAGITSSATAAQRKALSEISGKCYGLLVACFESLSLLHAFDPNMSTNENNDSVPTSLLQLATLVIPDYSAAPRSINAFPLAGDETDSFYLPVEATGALIKCLASCCEPAQGSKARAAILRLHRFITGNTAVHVLDGNEDDNDGDSTAESQEEDQLKSNWGGLVHTLIIATAEAIGILGSRFPEMVAQDEQEDSKGASPTTDGNAQLFSTIPLLSVEHHLVPLSSILKRKSMGRGKGRREAQALLRQVAKKLGSLNGTNIDTIEEHEGRRKTGRSNRNNNTTNTALSLHQSTATSPLAKLVAKFPTPTPQQNDVDELPLENPNHRIADMETEDAENGAEVDATHSLQQSFHGSDPEETIQFRDKISVSFIGFQQIYLAHSLRSVVADGLQRQLAQNPHVQHLFGIVEDLTRKIDRNQRKEQLQEAEELKNDEKRARQRERDCKAKARLQSFDE